MREKRLQTTTIFVNGRFIKRWQLPFTGVATR